MTLIEQNTYQIGNLENKPQPARLVMVSPNKKSLLFRFPEPIALHAAGGMLVGDYVGLLQDDEGNYRELHTDAIWTISHLPHG